MKNSRNSAYILIFLIICLLTTGCSDKQTGKTAELLREEDLIGMWVKGGGIELIVDLKEDGSLDSYVNVPEEDGMGPEYYKDGSWAIDGREVRMTIGNSEFYYHGNADSLIGDHGYVLTPMSEEVKQKFFSNR